jgi:hypothetical protein
METQRNLTTFHVQKIFNEDVIKKNQDPIHLYTQQTAESFSADKISDPYAKMKQELKLYDLEGLKYQVYTWKDEKKYHHWIIKKPSEAEMNGLKQYRLKEKNNASEVVFIIENYYNSKTNYFGRNFVVIDESNSGNIRFFGYDAQKIFELFV